MLGPGAAGQSQTQFSKVSLFNSGDTETLIRMGQRLPMGHHGGRACPEKVREAFLEEGTLSCPGSSILLLRKHMYRFSLFLPIVLCLGLFLFENIFPFIDGDIGTDRLRNLPEVAQGMLDLVSHVL